MIVFDESMFTHKISFLVFFYMFMGILIASASSQLTLLGREAVYIT